MAEVSRTIMIHDTHDEGDDELHVRANTLNYPLTT